MTADKDFKSLVRERDALASRIRPPSTSSPTAGKHAARPARRPKPRRSVVP